MYTEAKGEMMMRRGGGWLIVMGLCAWSLVGVGHSGAQEGAAGGQTALIMSRVSDKPTKHYKRMKPFIDYVVAHLSHLGIVKGDVERYELPNILGLNFVLHDSLGGGGSASLKNDAQGKTHGMAMLLMKVEVPDDYSPKVGGAGTI